MIEHQSSWPTYFIGSKDHLHAVGVLIAAWNMVESAYEALTQLVFPAHRVAGYRAFELLSHDGRVKLIKESLSRVSSQEETDYLDYFFKCSNICKMNRNVLSHSSYFGQFSSDYLMLMNTTNRTKAEQPISQYSLLAIREMADAAYETAQFGLRLFIVFSSRRGHDLMKTSGTPLPVPAPALPSKPALPRSWDQIRESAAL